jgi:hypothetical protein
MASLDDILTTQRNGVIAINNLSRQLASTNPTVTSDTLTTTTSVLEVVGSGLLLGVSVIAHSGSNVGYIYNSATVAAIGPTNAIAVIPASEGFYPLNIPYSKGLVFVAGSGMNVCITYRPN